MADDNLRIMPLSGWMSLAAIVTIAVLVGAVVRDWGDAHDALAAETERAAKPVASPVPEPPAAPATETLLADVDASNSPETRIAALRSLAGHADLGDERERVINAVIDASDRESPPDVRLAALAALGELGADRESAIAKLRAALEDTDESVRIAALGAVDQIGPGAADLLPSVLRSLEEPAPDEIGAAALALSALGRTARQHTEQLAQLMGHEARGEVGAPAATALARLGEAGDSALRTALESSDPWVRYHAASALLGEPEDLTEVTDESVAQAAKDLIRRLDAEAEAEPADAS